MMAALKVTGKLASYPYIAAWHTHIKPLWLQTWTRQLQNKHKKGLTKENLTKRVETSAPKFEKYRWYGYDKAGNMFISYGCKSSLLWCSGLVVLYVFCQRLKSFILLLFLSRTYFLFREGFIIQSLKGFLL